MWRLAVVRRLAHPDRSRAASRGRGGRAAACRTCGAREGRRPASAPAPRAAGGASSPRSTGPASPCRPGRSERAAARRRSPRRRSGIRDRGRRRRRTGPGAEGRAQRGQDGPPTIGQTHHGDVAPIDVGLLREPGPRAVGVVRPPLSTMAAPTPCCPRKSGHGSAHRVHTASWLRPPQPCKRTTNGARPSAAGRWMVTGRSREPTAEYRPPSSGLPDRNVLAFPWRHGTSTVLDSARPCAGSAADRIATPMSASTLNERGIARLHVAPLEVQSVEVVRLWSRGAPRARRRTPRSRSSRRAVTVRSTRLRRLECAAEIGPATRRPA